MRRAAKVDDNQKSIVAGLRRRGMSVQSLAAAGNGVPDLLVGFRGANVLIEIKDPTKPKSDRVLTPAQIEWHKLWRGQVTTVTTAEEAAMVVYRASGSPPF